MSGFVYGSTPQSQAQILPDEEETAEEIVVDDTTSAAPADTSVNVEDATGDEKPDTTQPSGEDEIPEPLRGKTPAQLAKMYVEAQKVIGRQGQEVGEVRRLADGLIKKQLADQHRAAAARELAPVKPGADDDTDTEFFKKPTDAVDRRIAEHPDLKALKEAASLAVQRERVAAAKAAAAEFQQAYPDAGATLASPEFREWIQASKVRQALFQRGHKAYDMDAANELFGTWKELQAAKAAAAPAKPTPKQKAAATKKELGAAAVPSGNAGAAGADSGKKIYRRVDIMNLMENNPERYEQLAPEIQKAYEEGRVR